MLPICTICFAISMGLRGASIATAHPHAFSSPICHLTPYISQQPPKGNFLVVREAYRLVLLPLERMVSICEQLSAKPLTRLRDVDARLEVR